ncbi:hypothetical protein GURASL_22500 [Geotalea uraniireducens]|uniref:Uncharacterized protein n=1 Tax=Geotalea uraniireducens TaxID=351604 RepID=A0ABM8ELK7_9BACT|nr:hypothetical protein [Geotalea uraniireducens]BDV43327.1 hypothetical protein GURASL_22500 [Geotalea uraniireducens]
MVVLVRCADDTITVALESSLNQLIKDGVVKSFLSSGEWIDTVNRQPEWKKRSAFLPEPRITAFVSCF